MLFVGASNQLGAVESGVVAWLTTATFAVVSGGAGCLTVLGIVAAKMPELRHYRAILPAEPRMVTAIAEAEEDELAAAAG
jgi:hypothetical protein